MESPDKTASQIAQKQKIESELSKEPWSRLHELGKIERIGSRRDGRWIVLGKVSPITHRGKHKF